MFRRRDLEYNERGEQKQHRAHAQGPAWAADRQQPSCRTCTNGCGDAREARKPSVGRHQFVRVVNQLLNQSLFDDPRCLACDQQDERKWIERQVEQKTDHCHATEATQQIKDRCNEALRPPEPVDGRSNERRQYRKRRHRHQEVQQHLLPRCIRADVEEQRSREADRDECISGARQAVRNGKRNDRAVADQDVLDASVPRRPTFHPGFCRTHGADLHHPLSLPTAPLACRTALHDCVAPAQSTKQSL